MSYNWSIPLACPNSQKNLPLRFMRRLRNEKRKPSSITEKLPGEKEPTALSFQPTAIEKSREIGGLSLFRFPTALRQVPPLLSNGEYAPLMEEEQAARGDS
ncbi:hypothetical protein AMTR_s01945p00002530 [Amborella trichopoda]|uniref:Uncharacterized protein n=1 Tax=Amborella trichopoda TaxID=13333 RepID=W1PK70_AMBTC|nr:hypothetical protein AMTR_s01945p00002530 [Amborella trichopoda]